MYFEISTSCLSFGIEISGCMSIASSLQHNFKHLHVTSTPLTNRLPWQAVLVADLASVDFGRAGTCRPTTKPLLRFTTNRLGLHLRSFFLFLYRRCRCRLWRRFPKTSHARRLGVRSPNSQTFQINKLQILHGCGHEKSNE